MPHRRLAWQSIALASLLLSLPTAAEPLPEGPSATGNPAAGAVSTSAVRSMVATANGQATAAGLAMLEAGGSAVDAAIAAQLVLNLVEPQSSGIGGGAFLLHWEAASSRLQTLDGRETAPAAAGPDYFLGLDGVSVPFREALVGGRAVGVPGTVALLAAAHGRWGRLPWARLFEPATALAQQGFAVSPRLAGAIAEAQDQGLRAFAPTAAYFFDGAGRPRTTGEVLRNPDFAGTLQRLAAEGSEAFYGGPIGRALVATVREAPVAPGLMTEADLSTYRAIERPPVCAPYRGYRVCGMGPPSSGGIAVLQILGLIERFDMAALGPGVKGMHVLLEAMKLAFADRNLYVADPDHAAVPTGGLLDPAYLAARSQLVQLERAAQVPVAAGKPPGLEAPPPAPSSGPDRPGTSHLVIVDANGNAVSMTTTIEAGFGSRLMSGGFLLNNELTDFSFRPSLDGQPVANRVEGGKRPRSSMAPMIVFGPDGRPVLLLGSPGGSRIIGYVAKTLVAVLDWGLPLDAAIAFGHMLNMNGPTELETSTPVAAFAPALEALGHTVRVTAQPSGVQAIQSTGGSLVGAADPRREGVAAGR